MSHRDPSLRYLLAKSLPSNCQRSFDRTCTSKQTLVTFCQKAKPYFASASRHPGCLTDRSFSRFSIRDTCPRRYSYRSLDHLTIHSPGHTNYIERTITLTVQSLYLQPIIIIAPRQQIPCRNQSHNRVPPSRSVSSSVATGRGSPPPDSTERPVLRPMSQSYARFWLRPVRKMAKNTNR